jgi:hypothetical protein
VETALPDNSEGALRDIYIRPLNTIGADSFGRILPDAATEQIRAGSRIYVW